MAELSKTAQKLLEKTYLREGETSWSDLAARVAKVVEVEGGVGLDYDTAFKMINDQLFVPSTPCLINADESHTGQLSACFIIAVDDNLESIYKAKAECAKIFQKNGGVGFNISALRPQSAPVETSGGYSCGPVGFMEEFDVTARIVTENNVRKGAIKIDLNDWHPDIHKFIACKDDTSKLQRMNISVSLSDAFMQAVRDDSGWELKFPDFSVCKDEYNQYWHGDLRDWESKGRPVKVYETLPARQLYKEIMAHAWKTGEPGVSFRDTMNRYNPVPHMGKVDSTNPCSEFCSIPYASCNLGSINLANLCVKRDGEYVFDWDEYKKLIADSVAFLDCMITANKLPIPEIECITNELRPIGLGTMGYADLLYKLRLPYGSEQSQKETFWIYKALYDEASLASKQYGDERGYYPAYYTSDDQSPKRRNATLLSIAPNGSIGTLCNTSGGIEPNFALVYTRRTNDGELHYIINSVFEAELKERGLYSEELIQRIADNHGSCQGVDGVPQDMQEVYLVASDLTPKQHLDVVSAVQRCVDLSISKTVNLLNDATVEDIEDVYLYAWEHGLKGVTIYRDGSRADQTLSTSTLTKAVEPMTPVVLPRGYVIDANDDIIGKKRKLNTGCGSLHCVACFDPASGDLLETYLSKGSTGGCQNFMIAVSRLISYAARLGGSIQGIADQLNSCGVCPSYAVRSATKHDTSKGACCPMAVGNALLDMWQQTMDELTADEDVEDAPCEEVEVVSKPETSPSTNGARCPECGAQLYFEGGCNVCKNCGWSRCG